MGGFKVGDKVKVVSLSSMSNGHGVKIGMFGEVVVEYDKTCNCVGVKFDHKIDGHALYYNNEDVLEPHATNGLWIEPECLKFIEEEKPMEPQFKNMKIRIKDEEHSRLVQETLFAMGYKWVLSGGVGYTQMPWLSTYENGCIYFGSKKSEFDDHQHEEVELVTTYSFKVVDQEALRKATEKETLKKNVAEMQKQLDEMKQKLENM